MKKSFSILFVCTGNICRSPTAEAIFRHRIEERKLSHRYRHDSAGVDSHHIGQAPDPRSRAALKQLGMRMDDLRARNMKPSDFYEFDLILAMDDSHFNALTRMAPKDGTATIARYLDYAHGQPGNVPDPYYGTTQDFLDVLTLIDDATTALLARLEQHK